VTQVDFYVLPEKGRADRYGVVCRLAGKAYAKGHRVYIHGESDAQVRHLDRLLWTFVDASFVPHGLVGEADPELTPVLLGHGRDPEALDDVLINLAPEVPDFFSRFRRVAEVVDPDPQARRAGRERFRFYRDRGYPLHTHELDP
jgi:DNA polymerase-3 subunit chi